jgi:hypothetical protein
MRTNRDFKGAPFADSVAHALASEGYVKCDWCGAPASFWIRQKNYCGDCLAARLPENKPEKDWWPAVQQVAAPAALTAKVRETAPMRAKLCAAISAQDAGGAGGGLEVS